MNLNPNIEEIEKKVIGKLETKLKDNPELQNSIEFEKVKEIYETVLEEMYPNSWKEARMAIGLKDPLEFSPLLERIMEKLEGKYEHIYDPIEGDNYFQRTE